MKIAKNYKTTLTVITQPLSLHYVFISYSMKPHSLEFMYSEREDSYTRPSLSWWKNLILNLVLWGMKRGGASPFIPEQNFLFKRNILVCINIEKKKMQFWDNTLKVFYMHNCIKKGNRIAYLTEGTGLLKLFLNRLPLSIANCFRTIRTDGLTLNSGRARTTSVIGTSVHTHANGYVIPPPH